MSFVQALTAISAQMDVIQFVPLLVGTFGAVAAGVIGAGATAYGASKQSKALKGASKVGRDEAKALERIRNQLQSGSLFGFTAEEVAGARPEVVDFERVDPGATIGEAAASQSKAVKGVADFVNSVNAEQALQDALRFSSFVPGGLQGLAAQGQAAASLSRGELPFDDVMKVVRDRSTLSNALGLGGTQFASAIPRDLGISRLQAIQSGAALNAQATNTLQGISPLAGQMNVGRQFIQGPQAVDLGLRQNILDQQQRQAAANVAAAPDPVAQALLSLELNRLQLRSSGQLAGAQLEASAAATQTAGLQSALGQIGGLFQPTPQTVTSPDGFKTTANTGPSLFSQGMQGIGNFGKGLLSGIGGLFGF